MSRLAERLLAELGSRSGDARPSEECDVLELQGRLKTAIEVARSAWPGVEVPVDEFVGSLAGRMSDAVDPIQALERVHVSDLYLVQACGRGDARALAHFDQHFLSQIPNYVARISRSREVCVEVQQRLREKLLTSRPGETPGILSYRGEGPLGAWVRVAAVRAAHDLFRGAKGLAETNEDPAQLADAKDPELLYLKIKYASEVSEAFRVTLAALSTKERTMLNRHYIDHMSTDAIARLYRVDGSTIRRRLERVRQVLLDEIHRRLSERLRLSDSEAQSVIALVRSQIDLSLGAQLKSGSR